MDNLLACCDVKVGKENTDSEKKNQNSEQLSSDIWSDIFKATNDVNQRLKNNETVKRALDALDKLAPPPKEKQADWTFAINFTTDFGDNQGVMSGMERLEEFAAKTKGSNVKIVAQAAFPRDAEICGEDIQCFAPGSSKYRLDRYLLADGKLKFIDSVDSNGYAADVESLVKLTSKNYPGKRMGLIIDSHGSGNEGLLGDTGTAGVDEFVQAVQNGLKDSGHAKFDILDFDTCLMAQDGALGKISKVADQVVASAETESIYNAQNYLDPIAGLIKKPETDGFTLARQIVSETHKDMEFWKFEGWMPAVQTLGHFNMRQYEQFKKNLDQFGEELVKSLNNPANRPVIEAAIDNSRKYGSSGHLMALMFGTSINQKNRTDLKDFTERVLSAIDSGEISDPDRTLKKAAYDVMSARGMFVDSYHGDGDYKAAGGISTFLPSRSLRNVEREVQMSCTAGRLKDLTDPAKFNAVNRTEKTRSEFLEKVVAESFMTNHGFFFFGGVKGVEKELKAVDDAALKFKSAANDNARKTAFEELHNACVTLAKSAPFTAIQDRHKNDLEGKVSKVYKANFIEETKDTGWSKFRLKLKQ